jgi:RNA polymerase sigma-70 factor, ECF subfamily
VRLANQLVRHLPDGIRLDENVVDELLEAALAEAHRRWPSVKVSAARFIGWVAVRVSPDAATVEESLRDLRLADLYLACGCADGDGAALAAFDLAYLAGDSRTSDDVKQLLRKKLFVAESGGAPRIALYAGRGDLARWVRAAMARLTIDSVRGEREIPTEDALLDAIGIYSPADGPDIAHQKSDARASLQLAIREAVKALTDRQRTLLLQHYIDGVGVVELGKLFGVAPSNVSRALAKARILLVSQIRRSLVRHKGIHGDQVDSLVDLVQSQLSLTGALRG